MRVGSAEIGGLIEIVEFDEPGDMAWTSITGIDQRARWRLREADDGAHQGQPAAQLTSPAACSACWPTGSARRWWRAARGNA